VTTSGLMDKRPVWEWLVDTDRKTGAFIPQLATKWEMAPNGKDWTVTLRKGVQWQDGWGEFTAKDVRHSLYLLVQPESSASNIELWRNLVGVKKGDTEPVIAKKVEELVEIVDDYTVRFHARDVHPDFNLTMSQRLSMMMESKARWDAVGHEGYGKKVVGTGPLKFVERVEGVRVVLEALDKHWRVTPDYKQLEFRWVPESATRLATLLTQEVHLSDIERDVRKEALARGMKVFASSFPSNQHRWLFGGLYFTEPQKLDPQNPFTNKKVRQAMNKAINRKAIVESLLAGSAVQLPFIFAFDPKLDEAIWPGIYNQQWIQRFDEMYGYDPKRARELLAEAGYPNGFGFTQYIFPLPGLAEMVDIGQAMALDFEKVGLKPKLEQLEFPKVREKYRAQTIGTAIWPVRGAAPTTSYVEAYLLTKSTAHAFQLPELDKLWEEFNRTVERGQRAAILRQMGDIVYDEFGVLQMFALTSEIVGNPKFIAEYVFPGNISGFFTHLEYIKTVPQ
jgi:peptide/nickel transport system substrate-binding protein